MSAVSPVEFRCVRWLFLVLLIAGTNQPIILLGSSKPQAQQASEIYHAGDLIVGGNETYVIENVTFLLHGNIIVKDNAKLIVKNARFITHTTYKGEFWAFVSDNAIFEAENSTLEEEYGLDVAFQVSLRGNAKLTTKSVSSNWRISSHDNSLVMIDRSLIPFLYWWGGDSPKVDVKNSEIYRCVNLICSGEKAELLRIVGLKRGKIDNFYITSTEGSSLRLENTTVGDGRPLSGWIVDMVNTKKNLILENSVVGEFWLEFPLISDVKIIGLKPGLYTEWNMYENIQGSGLEYNLTLINTTIEKWKLIFHSSKAELENVEAHIDTWDQASISIKDSKIVIHHNYGSKYTKISNSYIAFHLLIVYKEVPGAGVTGGKHFIDFENSTLDLEYIEVACDYAVIKGNVSIISTPYVNFQTGIIVREYPLIVGDQYGNPLFNASINLVDPESKSVWSGMTDQKGKALFNITFTKDNYSKEWRLMATVNSMNVSKGIGFLTSTPIVLTLLKLSSSISISVSLGKISLGESTLISGFISTPHKDTVTLTYKMPNGTVLTRTITSKALGEFEDVFTPEMAGNWTVKASWSGDSDHEGASRSINFIVKQNLPISYIVLGSIVIIGMISWLLLRTKRASKKNRFTLLH